MSWDIGNDLMILKTLKDDDENWIIGIIDSVLFIYEVLTCLMVFWDIEISVDRAGVFLFSCHGCGHATVSAHGILALPW